MQQHAMNKPSRTNRTKRNVTVYTIPRTFKQNQPFETQQTQHPFPQPTKAERQGFSPTHPPNATILRTATHRNTTSGRINASPTTTISYHQPQGADSSAPHLPNHIHQQSFETKNSTANIRPPDQRPYDRLCRAHTVGYRSALPHLPALYD